ncbi:hypothetical protein GDO81_025009 [Engystomops pustulosus]|uniref:Uncharacterized protein n=1 Tax=Engystomops pustulosus TaxID=76066 RepID=A0AAV6YIW6_ENGPU|nr:hypothetical protein GDO81_025009 [Engystomops pustulosus]
MHNQWRGSRCDEGARIPRNLHGILDKGGGGIREETEKDPCKGNTKNILCTIRNLTLTSLNSSLQTFSARCVLHHCLIPSEFTLFQT